MKLIKYLAVILVTIILFYGAGWYYLMNLIANEVNTNYAGKKHLIEGMSDEDYHTMFAKVSPTGFPFKFQIQILDWKEESKTAVINYPNPVYVGYNLLSQKLEINYDGQIISEYKPTSRKFGARFEIDKYHVKVDLPITHDLINTVKNMQDPFEVVNHLGKISAGTANVKIFDLNDNGKFYDKEYEKLTVTFQPAKYYTSLDDFLKNIPTHYIANYSVKTNPVTEPSRRLPVSLLYGFFTFPSNFYATASADIKTKAKTFDALGKDLDMRINFKVQSPYVDISSGKFEYASLIDKNIPSFEIQNDLQFKFKPGAFDKLFDQHMIIKPKLMQSDIGKFFNREIEYIINNKDAFKFKDLEDVNYDANLRAQGSDSKERRFIKLDNISIFSESSGFKVNAESTMKKGNIIKGIDQRVQADGVLYIQNYPSVVEFSSGYIYRFGKFRFLNDEARDIYIKANKRFLKKISDYPDSKSNDLSFEFEFDSNNYSKMKFGSIQLEQISDLYQTELFKILVDHVGIDSNFEERMKKIIPDLDLNSPILKKVLPKLKKLQGLDKDNLQNIVPKNLDKKLQKDAQKSLDKVIPNDFKKKINKELWKNMVQ